MKKFPPLVVMALAAGLMWGVSLVLPQANVAKPLRLAIVAALVVTGLFLAIAGVVEFRRARTTVDPRFPEKSSALVTTGVFRITRNPMYFAFALILCGWAVYLTSIWALIVVPGFVLFLDRYQVVPEERALIARFGNNFESY